MARHAVLLVAAFLLAACAGPQPSFYAPKEGRDGYAEETLPKGLYKVSFQGNRVTAREQAETYALFRAAELTLELEAEAFVVHDTLIEQLTTITRDWSHDPWAYSGFSRRYRYYSYRPLTPIERESTTYRAVLTIEPYSGAPPPEGGKRHDARAVVERLTDRVVRPPAEDSQKAEGP